MVFSKDGHQSGTAAFSPYIETIESMGAQSVVVAGDAFILTATYTRQGDDLLLSGADGREVLIRDYFGGDVPPDLLTENGARVTGATAEILAGPMAPGQFAQAAPQIAQAAPIGRVQVVEGQATATHTDGTTVTLTQGAPVFTGDVVQTAAGGKLGLLLIDKTTFSMGDNARMVLNELIYNPAGGQQSSVMTVLQGLFIFVTGEVGKLNPESVAINTPVATIGIRGTKGVIAEFSQVGGDLKVGCLNGTVTAQTGAGNRVDLLPGTSTRITSLNLPPLPPQPDPTFLTAPTTSGVDNTSKQMDPLTVDPGRRDNYGSGQRGENQNDGGQNDGGAPTNQEAREAAETQPAAGGNAGDGGETKVAIATESIFNVAAPKNETDKVDEAANVLAAGSAASEGETGTGDAGGGDSGTGATGGTGTGTSAGVPALATGDGGASGEEQNQFFGSPGPQITSISTNEDTSLTITASVSALTAGGGPLNVTLTVQNGTLVLNDSTNLAAVDSDGSDGSLSYTGTVADLNSSLSKGLVYTPNQNFNGSDPLAITVSDGQTSTAAQSSIIVVPVNDPPVASGDPYATGENAVLNQPAAGVLSNDVDPDGDPLTVVAVNGQAVNVGNVVALASGGSVKVQADGSFVFNPGTDFDFLGANQVVNTAFTYTVADPSGAQSTATATITVNGVNDAPAVDLNGPNGAGINFARLFVEGGGPVAVGDLDLTLSDIDNTTLASATVAITNRLDGAAETLAANVAGTAINASFDAQTGILSLTGVDSLANYQQVLRSVTYDNISQTPDSTTRNVSVIVNDGLASSPIATSAIGVIPINNVPTAGGDNFRTGENIPFVISAPGILANDRDGDGDPLTVVAVNDQPANVGVALNLAGGGVVTVQADGSFSFDPGSDFDHLNVFQGKLTAFNYTVSDPSGAIAITSVGIGVIGENDAPVIDLNGANGVGINFATTFTEAAGPVAVGDIDLTALDVDNSTLASATVTITNRLDGAAETLAATTAGTGIKASFNAQTGVLSLTGFDFLANYQQVLRSVTYDNSSQNPNTTARTVSVTVNDGTASSAVATSTIGIVPVNQAPVAVADQYATGENTVLNVAAAAGVLANDTDADGNPLTVVAVGGQAANVGQALLLAGGGSVTVQANGSFAFNPGAAFDFLPLGQAANTSFTYTVADPSGAQSTATATVTVNGANDAPVAQPDLFATGENTVLNVGLPGLLANDADVDGNVLRVSAVAGQAANVGRSVALAGGGSVTVQADGSFSFNPGTDFDFLAGGQNGQTSFTYTAIDTAGAQATTTATIFVGGVNDAPVVDLDLNDSSGKVGGNFATTFTEDGGPVKIGDVDLTVSDVDSGTLASATVTITNLLDGGFETLAANTSGTGIMANYDAMTGILTLNGVDSVANYQQVLRSVTYNNSDQSPTPTDRAIQVVVNDGAANSTPVFSSVSVVPVNDAPVAVADQYNTTENVILVVGAPGILANDTDAEGDALSVAGGVFAGDNGGTFTLQNDGSFTFDPGNDFNDLTAGTSRNTSIVYQASDGAALSAQQTATVTVNGVNSGPVPILDADASSAQGVLEFDATISSVAAILANDIAVGNMVHFRIEFDPTIVDTSALSTSGVFPRATMHLSLEVLQTGLRWEADLGTSGGTIQTFNDFPAGATLTDQVFIFGGDDVTGSITNVGPIQGIEIDFLDFETSPTVPQMLATDGLPLTVPISDNDPGFDSNFVTLTLPAGAGFTSFNFTNIAVSGGPSYAARYTGGGVPIAIADSDVLITDADSQNISSATITLTNPSTVIEFTGTIINVDAFAQQDIAIGNTFMVRLELDPNAVDDGQNPAGAQYQNSVKSVTIFVPETGQTWTAVPSAASGLTRVFNDANGGLNFLTDQVFSFSDNITGPTIAGENSTLLQVSFFDFETSPTVPGMISSQALITRTPLHDGDANDSNLIAFNTPTNGFARVTLGALTPLGGSEGLQIAGVLPAGITATVNTAGQIVLSGNASFADYQTAISQIQYQSNALVPSTGVKTIEVTLTDDSGTVGPTAQSQINVVGTTAGNDVVAGTAGNDVLGGGLGDDTVLGFAGDDNLLWNEGDGNDMFVGGSGADSLLVRGSGSSAAGLGDHWTLKKGGTELQLFQTNTALTLATLDISQMESILFSGSGGNDSLRIIGNFVGTSITNSTIQFDGGDGNDALDAPDADRKIVADGGAGNDVLETGFGDDVLSGGDGNDRIDGNGGDDLIIGDAGDDFLIGGDGDDILLGGAGDDVLAGGPGDDILDGGAGLDDVAVYFRATAGLNLSLLTNTAVIGSSTDQLSNIEHVVGTEFRDSIIGDAGANELYGLGDSDIIQGGDGDDFLDGGLGFDSALYTDATSGITAEVLRGTVSGGGVGTDRLVGFNRIVGSDFIDLFRDAPQGWGAAMEGNVHEFEGRGANDIILGVGVTRAGYAGALNGVAVDLQAGSATDIGGASVGMDQLFNVSRARGSNFDDTFLSSTTGFNEFRPNDGVDTVTGQGAVVRVDYGISPGPVDVDLSLSRADNDGYGNTDQLINVRDVIGSDNNDILRGDGGDNQLFGGLGNDVLAGRGGADLLNGGDGLDSASYTGAGGPITVDMTAGTVVLGGTTDTLVSVERVFGTIFGDTYIGGVTSGANTSVNRFRGGAGDDLITGSTTTVIDYSDATNVGVVVNITPGSINDASAAGLGTDSLLGNTEILGVTGSDFDDTLTGNARDTSIPGNTVVIFTGNTLQGNAGNDVIDGAGGGVDFATYFTSPNRVVVNLNASPLPPSGTDPQVASGTALDGFGTTDTLRNIEGIQGSAFDDIIIGNGAVDNLFRGLRGDDFLDGGIDSFNNTAIYLGTASSPSTQGIDADLSAGTIVDNYGFTDTVVRMQNVIGSEFDDIIRGDSFINTLHGWDGNDLLVGDAGDDLLIGGQGTDRADYSAATAGIVANISTGIVSGDLSVGTDSLTEVEGIIGSDFADTYAATGAVAGNGNSTFNRFEGLGGDDLIAGNGNTALEYASASAGVTVTFNGSGSGTAIGDSSVGTDTFTGVNSVRGSLHSDIFIGDAGNESFRGRSGDDFLDGGAGTGDEADYRSGLAGVDADLQAGSADDGWGFVDTLINIENLRGGDYDDVLRGDGNSNQIIGNAGDDLIEGRGGNDFLFGNDGNDSFLGGAGDDVIDGGAGFDRIDYADETASVTVDLGNNTASGNSIGTDTLLNIEHATGSAGADTLIGSSAANTLIGGDGDDTIVGGGGNDHIELGNGADTLVYTATTDGETIAVGEIRGPSRTGDIVVDFTSGIDTVQLGRALTGGAAIAQGVNFTVIGNAFDGTLTAVQATASYNNNQATLVYSTADATLSYLQNGAASASYTVLFSSQDPTVQLVATDVASA